jgi:hypothetical protein
MTEDKSGSREDGGAGGDAGGGENGGDLGGDLGGGYVARIARSAAREMGYEEVAKIIDTWPELVGKAIAAPHNKIRDLLAEGKPVPPELAAEAQRAIEEHPEEAVLLYGPLLAAGFDGALGAAAERRRILALYRRHLDTIAGLAAQMETSLALRGFLHGADCISYWHRARARGGAFEERGDRLEPPVGLDIYLLDFEPTDEAIAELNRLIRKSDTRTLPKAVWDHYERAHAGKLARIEEGRLIVNRLKGEAGGAAKAEARDDPFEFRPMPRDVAIEIPPGAPGLTPMLESLFAARQVQAEPLAALEKSAAAAEALVAKMTKGDG